MLCNFGDLFLFCVDDAQFITVMVLNSHVEEGQPEALCLALLCPVKQHVERYCDLTLESGWQLKAIEAADKAATRAAGADNGSPAAAAAGGNSAAQAGADAGAGAAAGPGPGRVRTSNCSVYLASDEAAVAEEIRVKYRHIHLIVNKAGLKASESQAELSHTELVVLVIATHLLPWALFNSPGKLCEREFATTGMLTMGKNTRGLGSEDAASDR
jgi:hypothetical protein